MSTEDLDRKLAEILKRKEDADYTVGVPVVHDGVAVADLKKRRAEVNKVIVEQIKQAFKDADWVDKKELKTWSYTEELLSGQEWYDRFEKELGQIKLPGPGSANKYVLGAVNDCHSAAKKAAGLEPPQG